MSNATIIDVHGLTHTYGSGEKAYTAVADSSFTVARGEVFGLLGTNGAGKTTTLEIMEGLTAPTSGEITILGADPLADRKTLRPYLGIMLQSGGLPPELTTRQTLQMWAGTCAAPLRIDDVLAEVHLAHRADIKVGQMSGGEQRRLDLACALIGDPHVLFLDEPTTGLDPESRRNVWSLLERLKDQGVTMMLTTHYLEEAERLCDRVAIMHCGEIVVSGTTPEIAASASSEITAVLPPDHPHLPDLAGAHTTLDGTRLRITTSQLQRHTAELLNWANGHRLQLDDFTASTANLESVFLSIADRSSLQ